jgi:hypothetical protein
VIAMRRVVSWTDLYAADVGAYAFATEGMETRQDGEGAVFLVVRVPSIRNRRGHESIALRLGREPGEDGFTWNGDAVAPTIEGRVDIEGIWRGFIRNGHLDTLHDA